MNCRHCGSLLEHLFLNLGLAPPTNAYRVKTDLQKPEREFPLKLFVCVECWLVQTEDFTEPEELFTSDYPYYSSTSQSWLDHASQYVKSVSERFELNAKSQVIEIASNDGYLLKNFITKGIPCLGIEPSSNTADAAEDLGIPVVREFFSSNTAFSLIKKNKQADLVLANNVYAHVPDINDFTLGIKRILKPAGTITIEFPHLLRLLEDVQFDTVYHEHFSYLSLQTVDRIFRKMELRVWDVETLSTHGGSLRIYGCHEDDPREVSAHVTEMLAQEKNSGLQELSVYQNFQKRADRVKTDLLRYLEGQKMSGKKIAAYGAAAKGNTFLNYAGIKTDLISFICDAAPSKQGKYMPGSHIPILPINALRQNKPDIILILPWNLATEIISQNSYVREWGGKFITAIPKINIIQ